jgi:hypothetical protein
MINWELSAKLQHEFQGFSDRVDILKTDTEHGIDNLTECTECSSEGMSKRYECAHFADEEIAR